MSSRKPRALAEKRQLECALSFAVTRQRDDDDWAAMHTVGKASLSITCDEPTSDDGLGRLGIGIPFNKVVMTMLRS